MDPNIFKVVEREAGILRAIAEQYSRESKEYGAIQRAAFALHYVLTHDHDKFVAFVRECQQELTPEQKAHLAELGLDVK